MNHSGLSRSPYSKSACTLCWASKRKCNYDPLLLSCERCRERGIECVLKSKRKPGPKTPTSRIPSEFENFSTTPQLSDGISFNSELSNEKQRFCTGCRTQEKRCIYHGVPGEFRCEECKKGDNECLFQCIKCCKKRDLFSSCTDCKETKEDPPHSITIDTDTQKLYLQHSNCNHKIEITPTLINAMIKSHKEVGRVTGDNSDNAMLKSYEVDQGNSDNARSQITDDDSNNTTFENAMSNEYLMQLSLPPDWNSFQEIHFPTDS
ncbi:14733_t:CDS:2 [Acaulospora morrowiae]|uniref:14733_t:CDS:1 n=1 Tax=Acaulospora morrowiae TaxID=94023 RepID=A0A9N8VXL4_9GLOM|nr:14733_t:CDS:2 [Acaulospora morrowiae]